MCTNPTVFHSLAQKPPHPGSVVLSESRVPAVLLGQQAVRESAARKRRHMDDIDEILQRGGRKRQRRDHRDQHSQARDSDDNPEANHRVDMASKNNMASWKDKLTHHLAIHNISFSAIVEKLSVSASKPFAAESADERLASVVTLVRGELADGVRVPSLLDWADFKVLTLDSPSRCQLNAYQRHCGFDSKRI